MERICRETLRATRSLLSEFKLPPTHWPSLSELGQNTLNNAPLERLGLLSSDIPNIYRSPQQVMTNAKRTTPLLRLLRVEKYLKFDSLPELRARQLISLTSMQESFEQLHRSLNDRLTAARKKSIDIHNKRTNVQPVSFCTGDYVLMRVAQPTKSHKLSFKWIGPRRIVEVKSDLAFVVEDLLSKKSEVVHARRLKFFTAADDGLIQDQSLIAHAQFVETSAQLIHSIHDIRPRSGQTSELELLIEWTGLPDQTDFTWEPFSTILQDSSTLVEDFLLSPSKRAIKRRALAAYFKS